MDRDAYNVIELRVTKRSSPGPFGFLLRAENDRAVVSGAAPGGDPVVVGVGYHISAVNSVDVEDLTFDQILRLVDQIPTGQRVSLMLKGPPKRGRLDSQLSILDYETVEATEQAKMDLLSSLRGRMKVKKGKQGHTIFQESDLSDHDDDDEDDQPQARGSQLQRSSNGFGKTAVRSSKSFTNGNHDSSRQPPRQRNVFRDGRNAIPETEEDTEEDAGNGRAFTDRRPAPVTNGGPRSMQVSKRNADSQPVKLAKSSSSAGSNKETPQEPMELINVLDGKTIVDTLHYKSRNRVECDATTCAASLMKSDKPVGIPNRTQEEVLRETKDFFKQYFENIKQLDSSAHRERWADVENDILSKGSYEFEPPELYFGARTAWRNAQRCIGRIQWSNLQFFDGRDCDTPKKMFDVLVKHIRYATNGGNLRSACTLFRQRMNGPEDDFRIWNAQLVRYAGYKMPDGSIVGDPANVEFTEVCQRLGWHGPGGRFDVLPLVLQANGQDPQYFEIPKDAVLEVDLAHPEYPEFAEMGLRWYALPAVANMFLDIGGQIFPACAFSGWYLQTEVARDFCDANRYNLLEDLASVFGFDTSKLSSLWKDQTFLEVNRAVLYSFQQVAKVTISDHHSISDSFMTHLQNEQRLRGGCPADWIWIVPPLGGSLLPVFHQEMIEYRLTPSYEYQDPPYRHHVWRDKKLAQPVVRTSSSAKSNRQGSSRSSQVPQLQLSAADKVRATVIYASETGKSNKFALMMGDVLKKVFDVNVVAANEYDVQNLKDEQLVLVITSTFGNGDPPENGKEFAAALHQMSGSSGSTAGGKDASSLSTPKRSGRRWSRTESYIRIEDAVKKPNRRKSQTGKAEDSSGILRNIHFAVFGLGSTSYPHYCAFAHYVDECLFNLGGKRILPMHTGDELNGQDQSFKEWSLEILSAACEAFGISAPPAKSSSSKTNGVNFKNGKNSGAGWSKGKFRLGFKSAPVNEDIRSGK
ncbi:hypothetical protein RvY_04004-2 [Ramazzottius varieornatus]|uniref:nitric-oxide synthase (NADPH) n=1 Tax=Ramazzottius varieornatus TaxID=947166 RepID=A0A1D1UQ15_RAMVA|nr:hypothetical protein RvY_04004-2 [Ramazzottius varieornatus]